jgi:hypothetical protein
MRFFGRTRKRERVDEQLGLRVLREGKHIRVLIGDRSVLFSGTSPEHFVRDYRAALAAIELEFAGTLHDSRVLEFSAREQDELRRDIVLHWIRYYLSTGQRVQVRLSDLDHPQTWAIVLRKAEAKYGSRSEDAMWLAAHTVGSDLRQFELWRRVEDDRVANM